MSNILVFYSASDAAALSLAYATYKKHTDDGDTVTLKDVSALTEANIDTYIGTLTDATYDKAYFMTPGTGSTGYVTSLNKYTLRAKMKSAAQGTDGATIDNITTHTTTQVGDSAMTWTVNEHVGKYVYLNGGTGANQIAYIQSNSATVLTLGDTLTTDPDTTTDIAIIEDMEYYSPYVVSATTGANMKAGWDYLYSTNSRPVPYIFHVQSDKFASESGTSTAVAATTLTDTAKTWTVNAYAGMYVQLGTGTTFGHQYGYIASNTATVLTITGWINRTAKGTPTGTPTYKIVNTLGEVFHDEIIKLYILTYFRVLTSSSVLAAFKNVIDKTDGDETRPVGSALIQDQDFIFGTMVPVGSNIFDYQYVTA